MVSCPRRFHSSTTIELEPSTLQRQYQAVNFVTRKLLNILYHCMLSVYFHDEGDKAVYVSWHDTILGLNQCSRQFMYLDMTLYWASINAQDSLSLDMTLYWVSINAQGSLCLLTWHYTGPQSLPKAVYVAWHDTILGLNHCPRQFMSLDMTLYWASINAQGILCLLTWHYTGPQSMFKAVYISWHDTILGLIQCSRQFMSLDMALYWASINAQDSLCILTWQYTGPQSMLSVVYVSRRDSILDLNQCSA